MSGPRSVPMKKVFNGQSGNKDHINKEPASGPSLKATYLTNCRLCLSGKLGKNTISVLDEQLKIMLNHVFRFPITFQKGLPLNVCIKCYKGVELFYRYTYQVLENQKTLEEAMIPDKKLRQGNIKNAIHARAPNSESNQGKSMSNVIRIDCNDGFQKEMNDYLIDVDMQCDPASDSEDSRDAYLQPSNPEDIETHFVAVPGIADIWIDSGTDGTTCNNQPNKKPVEDAPFVIEIISASEDEFEMNAEDESVTNHNNNHTTAATQNRGPVLKAQHNERASSQAKPVAASVKNTTKLENLKHNLAGSVTLVNFADITKDGGRTLNNNDRSSTNALPSRRSVRNTIKQQNATKSTKCYPRRSFN